MCGRYVAPDDAAIEREFNLVRTAWRFPMSYNVAPTHSVPVVRRINGELRGHCLRWGLIPFFARGEPPKYATINARLENVDSAASYRGPWSRAQRCLQLACGFFEWHLDERGRKAPYYIHLTDQPLFALAGLWDRSTRPDGTVIESCVHITMPANELMHRVHNGGSHPHRMPAILRREDREAWLSGTEQDARAVLQPYSAALMDAYEVSAAVNSPANNGAANLAPVGASAPPPPAAAPPKPGGAQGSFDF